MCTSGNRDCQWTSRSVLKDFTEDALTIAAGILFQNCDGAYNLSVCGTRRRGRVALCGLHGRRWTPRGIPGDHG